MTPHPRDDSSWIQTFTGLAFWPLNPIVADIAIADIAHSLSMLCRYGGATREFFSVAEHCVLMSHAVPPEDALWALLHDAAETYMVDVPRPIKHQMPDYVAAEDALLDQICIRFGLDLACPPAVKDADLRMLIDEREALMAPVPRPWPATANLEPLGVTIHSWSPAIAEQMYLQRFAQLWTTSK